jgi:hypothetical protein
MSSDYEHIHDYVRHVIKGRWPEYEKHLIDIGDLKGAMNYGEIFSTDHEGVNDMMAFYSKVNDSILKKKARMDEPQPAGSIAESFRRMASLIRS